MSSKGEILENTLSQEGMRWLHVVSMGLAVDAEYWLSQVAPFSRPLVEMQRQYEPGLDLHHLRMWWPVTHELVTVTGGPAWLNGRQALLRKIEKGQLMREAIQLAGVEYADLSGRWPDVALTQSIPAGATDQVLVYEDSEERIVVSLEALETLPRGFVLMAKRESELK
jgi:hypothetical protein